MLPESTDLGRTAKRLHKKGADKANTQHQHLLQLLLLHDTSQSKTLASSYKCEAMEGVVATRGTDMLPPCFKERTDQR